MDLEEPNYKEELCPICYLPLYAKSHIPRNVSPCQEHKFCANCLISYIQDSCYSLKTLEIKCPMEGCNHKGTKSLIKSVIHTTLMELKLSLGQEVKHNPNASIDYNEQPLETEERRLNTEEEDEPPLNTSIHCKMNPELEGLNLKDLEKLYDAYERFYNRDIAIKYGLKMCIQDCGRIMERDKSIKSGEIWTCKHCKINVCGKCMNLMHEGTSCDQADKLNFRDFKNREKVVNCPNCTVSIFKDKGCNHITCG